MCERASVCVCSSISYLPPLFKSTTRKEWKNERQQKKATEEELSSSKNRFKGTKVRSACSYNNLW